MTEKVGPDGMMVPAVRPYMMDLGSTNGTFLNNERLESQRYYELLEQVLVICMRELAVPMVTGTLSAICQWWCSANASSIALMWAGSYSLVAHKQVAGMQCKQSRINSKVPSACNPSTSCF